MKKQEAACSVGEMSAIASALGAKDSKSLSVTDAGVLHIRGVARALGYPSWEVLDFRSMAEDYGESGNARTIRPTRECRRFVAFLEHRKIRALPVAERTICDLDLDPGLWLVEFDKYATTVGSPKPKGGSKRRQQLHWLAGHALSLEFEDLAASGTLAKKEAAAKRDQEQKSSGSSTATKASIEELDGQLRELASSTGLAPSTPLTFPDDQSRLQLLHEIERVLSRRLGGATSPRNHDKKSSNKKGSNKKDASSLLQSLNSGLKTGRPAVDKAVLVARMLHVSRLRILQNRINQVLEVGQDFIANPKTDSKLGRVGR